MAEDPFTSVQWDREDKQSPLTTEQSPIFEEESEQSPSNSLLIAESSIKAPSVHLDQEIVEQEPESEIAPAEADLAPEPEPEPQDVLKVVDLPPAEAEQRQLEAQYAQYSIELRVSHPLSDRDGNAKLFISYLITTTTDHPSIKKLLGLKEEGKVAIKIRRRYGDFRFLHDCLATDFPQVLVPPLPPKLNFKYLTGDTFSTAFVHKRLHSLDRFMCYLAQHKTLSQLAVFHYFVSDSGEWQTFTKTLKVVRPEDDLFVSKVVNEDLLTETVMNFFTASKHKRETNKDMLEISDKLKKLYENLVRLEKIFSKLNRKHSDLSQDYEQFLAQVNRLGAVQGDEDGFAHNFKVFGDALLALSENWGNVHRHVDELFLVLLRDCAKYIVRFSDLIELQHNKRIDLHALQEYLVKARGDLAALGGAVHTSNVSPPTPALIGLHTGGIVSNTTQLIKDTLSTSATPHIGLSQTDGKRVKLQQKVHQLEVEIAAQTELVNNLTTRIIQEEYPSWDRFNKKQLKQLMVELCDQEIGFYKGLAESWSDVEQKLMKRLDELQ